MLKLTMVLVSHCRHSVQTQDMPTPNLSLTIHGGGFGSGVFLVLKNVKLWKNTAYRSLPQILDTQVPGIGRLSIFPAILSLYAMPKFGT